MKHGSLFSGIGGFDLAAQWMGWDNIFHCEWNEFGQKVLKYHFPKSISYGDITKTDFTIHRGGIDILTGGFPCQPFSAAGKRKGTEDDRHLWPEMLRAIREIQPRYIVAENVRGFTNWNGGMVFDQVLSDLEAEGYEVLPFLLPACAVNAPHRRDRIWIVAHSTKDTWGDGVGDERPLSQKIHEGGFNELEPIANTTSAKHKETLRVGNETAYSTLRNIGGDGPTPDTGNERLQGGEINGSPGRVRTNGHQFTTGFVRPGWQDFPTQSPLRWGDDGLPSRLDGITFPKWRNESIKGYGNAIVPQVAFELFKVIDKM